MAAKAPKVTWEQSRPAPVVLVSGPEALTSDRARTAIRRQLKADHPDLEVLEVSAPEYQSGSLLTMASPSLFGEPRLIIVDDVERTNDAFLSDALRYLQAPEVDVTLLLMHHGGNRGKKLLDTVRAHEYALEVTCPELKRDSDRQQFVQQEFRAARRNIAGTAVRALVDAFASDLSELASACQQLIQDVEGPITEDHVDQYFGGRAEVTAFKVADAVVGGDVAAALGLFRQAQASGVDPIPLVAAIAAKLRLIAKVAGLQGPSAQLAKEVGASPWQIDRARRESRLWNEQQLARAIALVAQTDADLKGASRTPTYRVERMLRIVGQRAA